MSTLLNLAAIINICALSPNYFIKEYFLLRDISSPLYPNAQPKNFIPNPYQADIITKYHNQSHSIILSPRQSGLSVTTSAYILWHALFNDNQNIILMSNQLNSTLCNLDTIKFAIEYLPPFAKLETSRSNSEIRFSNGSTIGVRNATTDSLRGNPISLLFVDNANFLRKNEILDLAYLERIDKVILASNLDPWNKNLDTPFITFWDELANNDKSPFKSNIMKGNTSILTDYKTTAKLSLGIDLK